MPDWREKGAGRANRDSHQEAVRIDAKCGGNAERDGAQDGRGGGVVHHVRQEHGGDQHHCQRGDRVTVRDGPDQKPRQKISGPGRLHRACNGISAAKSTIIGQSIAV